MAEARQFKIKTGTLRRLRKELEMYIEEEKQEQANVQKLIDQGADSHDIKYAENILAESTAMVPDTRQRLDAALRDLQGLLEETGSVEGEAEEVRLAREEVAAAAALSA